jgi:23S rRNA (guanosine2251-2'-O)-methyltransferase
VKQNQITFGIHPVLEALEAGKPIDKIYIQREARSEGLNEIRQKALKLGVLFQFVPVEKLNRLTKGNHQGVVALSAEIDYADIEVLVPTVFEQGRQPFVLVLDKVTDVRNFGAICRSASCAGVDAIIIPTHGAALINSDAMKASAGALNIIPVCRSLNLKITLKFLKDSGFTIFSCTEKNSKPYYQANFTDPTAIIMGSEEDGVSGEYLKLSDELITIPMAGQIASLNVSVATGIVLFEVLRQRTK